MWQFLQHICSQSPHFCQQDTPLYNQLRVFPSTVSVSRYFCWNVILNSSTRRLRWQLRPRTLLRPKSPPSRASWAPRTTLPWRWERSPVSRDSRVFHSLFSLFSQRSLRVGKHLDRFLYKTCHDEELLSDCRVFTALTLNSFSFQYNFLI